MGGFHQGRYIQAIDDFPQNRAIFRQGLKKSGPAIMLFIYIYLYCVMKTQVILT